MVRIERRLTDLEKRVKPDSGYWFRVVYEDEIDPENGDPLRAFVQTLYDGEVVHEVVVYGVRV